MDARIYDNIAQVIGQTPIVRLNRMPRDGWAEMLVKLESFNPGGSVKDRIGLSMIEAAEREGRLKPGGTIVEPTSGNTGIGLAMVGAAKGYRVILTMPEEYSVERVTLLRAYGAQVVLTPRAEAMQGAIDKAEELLRQHPDYFMPQQFRNPANPEVHRKTTAKEILDVLGEKLDALVVGLGTGGTATGTGEILKQKIKSLKVFAIEPAESPVFSGGKAGPHKIQGIGAGFIPEVFNRKVVDRFIPVSYDDARNAARRLAEQEGILCGISSGAILHASCTVAQELGRGKRLLAILPDTGERYLSTELFS
ncbi:MAG: cysteine synthase A [Acidobacteria bacterium 13_1_40CM_4_58_4]|nr:MAG: cysteine synthase A [Acidobacteria bacterium 13_1_40CM_4_58_4]